MFEKKKIPENVIKATIRKVQTYHGERSMTLVLPKEFAMALQIEKGDFMKVSLDGTRLILEKADIN